MANVLDDFYKGLDRRVKVDRTAKVREPMNPKIKTGGLLFWAVLLIVICSFALRPSEVLTLDHFAKQAATLQGLTFKEDTSPVALGEVEGLSRVGYAADNQGNVAFMVMQFNSNEEATAAEKKYAQDLQTGRKDNLMIVINTKDQTEASRYLDTLDHTR